MEPINTSQEVEGLVDRAIAGDGDAFGKLYDMHVDRVYRHIYYRVGDAADAEDLTQQVFIKAWQAVGRYKRAATPFIVWLIKIGHNLVIDHYRSNKPMLNADFDLLASDSDKDPQQVTEALFNRQQILQAVNRLPGDQARVVSMRYIEDFSYEEIAAALGKSEGTIRVILHRGLQKLKTMLDRA